MSDTPETDAKEASQSGLLCGSANLNFARDLERRLNATISDLARKLEIARNFIDAPVVYANDDEIKARIIEKRDTLEAIK